MSNEVFKGAGKAETKLKNIEKARQRRLHDVNAAYDLKRDTFVASLSAQTRQALRFAGVLEWEGGEKLPGVEPEAAPE